jgi:broad specificity phosphatase PhoE
MTFKDKYLKYKIKYLKFKNQIGSGNIYTSIIVTHNGKLRCLLDKLGFSDNGNYNIREKKFKNCVILKLQVTSNKMSIEMIDQGDLSKDDNYDTNLYFTSFNKTLNSGLSKAGDNTFIFYLVRHGDGTHNRAKIRGSKKKIIDPSLTKIGEEQCIQVGRKLKELEINFNFLFVSELVRTRQSLLKIIEGGIMFKPLNKVIVLPCSRELVYDSDSCDVNQATTQENEMLCNPLKSDKTNYCKKLGDLTIDWSYYLKFHGDQIIRRSANCKDTEMISEAIKIVLAF